MTQRVDPLPDLDDPFLLNLSRLLLPVAEGGGFRPGSRAAAVTAILYRRRGEWHLPFVGRRADLSHHPGQVGLPGGSLEPGEGPWQAAAREAEEEIGVPARELIPVGAALTIYAAVTNFSVAPFVAWLPDEDVHFVHDMRELDRVLEVPLTQLLAAESWLDGGAPWLGRYLPVEDTRIWGLTERILAGLLPKLKEALEG